MKFGSYAAQRVSPYHSLTYLGLIRCFTIGLVLANNPLGILKSLTHIIQGKEKKKEWIKFLFVNFSSQCLLLGIWR